MKRLTKEQLDQMITDMAHQVMRFLKDSGAVRKADNVEPPWFSKDEICDRCDIPPAMFGAVKERAWELGEPLCHGYFTGWYVGFAGEQMRCMVQHHAVIAGLADSASRGFMAFGKSGTLKEGADYLKRAGLKLCDFPALMKVLRKPLPPEATQFLLDSGDDDNDDGGYDPDLAGLA